MARKKKADDLLSMKDNQSALKQDIEEYIKDAILRESMDSAQTREKNGGRLETLSAFVAGDIGWLPGKSNWKNVACIGAIQSQTEYKDKTSSKWYYDILLCKPAACLIKSKNNFSASYQSDAMYPGGAKSRACPIFCVNENIN